MMRYDKADIINIITMVTIGLTTIVLVNANCFEKTKIGQCHKYREYEILPI